MKLYERIARLFKAVKNCKETNNKIWEDAHTLELERLVKERMPSGSGIDAGVKFRFDHSRENKLVFLTAFHHMDADGFYTGWTNHGITVLPDLFSKIQLKVGGVNRNGIKEYLEEIFYEALTQEIDDEKTK